MPLSKSDLSKMKTAARKGTTASSSKPAKRSAPVTASQLVSGKLSLKSPAKGRKKTDASKKGKGSKAAMPSTSSGGKKLRCYYA